jgi:hypothetical protein
MNGTENGKIKVPVFAEAQIAESFVEDPFHSPLVLDATARVPKEILVEIDPAVLVPP